MDLICPLNPLRKSLILYYLHALVPGLWNAYDLHMVPSFLSHKKGASMSSAPLCAPTQAPHSYSRASADCSSTGLQVTLHRLTADLGRCSWEQLIDMLPCVECRFLSRDGSHLVSTSLCHKLFYCSITATSTALLKAPGFHSQQFSWSNTAYLRIYIIA